MKPQETLHLAVGRAYLRNILKYGSWDGAGPGYRYAPSQPPPVPPTPGTPSPYPTPSTHPSWPSSTLYNMAVGLKSVAQLTSRALFSGFQGITEVYNVVDAGNADDHFPIPGTE